MFDGVCAKHRACGTTVGMKNPTFPVALGVTGLVAGLLLAVGQGDVQMRELFMTYQHPIWGWLTVMPKRVS